MESLREAAHCGYSRNDSVSRCIPAAALRDNGRNKRAASENKLFRSGLTFASCTQGAGNQRDKHNESRISFSALAGARSTYFDREALKPGSSALDAAAHCGTPASGQFCKTLTGTGVFSGWIEERSLLNSGEPLDAGSRIKHTQRAQKRSF